MYEVGFKDVYPWVWSVMLGVSLMLAERRGAFQSTGAHSSRVFWLKNISAVFLNVVVPAFFFGLTMIRLGPKYSQNMNLQQILGTLYLAGAPLGSHHLWELTATKFGWVRADFLPQPERETRSVAPYGNLVWALVAFGIPAFASILGWRVP